MLCEKCQESEATIHLTQVVDGAVKKLHLCDECASDSGFDINGPVSITDILLGMGGEAAAVESTPSEKSCAVCHMRKPDFKKTGRLGCPSCYDSFSDDLNPLIKAMHRRERHTGKVPAREGVKVRMSAEIHDLQDALNKAVASEDFEQAATIRDQIQVCRKRLEKEERKEAS